jgi:hypothetical protein
VAELLGESAMAILDIDDIPEVLEYLCQGAEGDWMLALSKKSSLFPVMQLTVCYDLGDFSLLLGSSQAFLGGGSEG